MESEERRKEEQWIGVAGKGEVLSGLGMEGRAILLRGESFASGKVSRGCTILILRTAPFMQDNPIFSVPLPLT